MLRESDILFQVGKFWVTTSKSAGLDYTGFVVWSDKVTHSQLVARIGFEGKIGLEKAKLEAIKRHTN